ncbi:MAG: RND family transporter, partial [Desulfurivibrionaceae bacterium]
MKGHSIIGFSIKHPKTVTAILVVCTLLLASLIVKVRVDTDPENMLREDEPVRVFHNQMKEEFNLNDFVVLGVVNEQDPAGIFNVESLTRVHELTEFVRNMHAEDDPDKRVVTRNMIAPGTVDAIEQAGLGQVRFDWLMKIPPTDAEGVERIRQLAMNNPLLRGTLVSEDERAMGIYIPVSEKDFAAEVRIRLLDKIATYDKSNGDQFYITGLPVAEDTFGKEMFVQMAVSAPLAMLAIFLLMLVFFRQVKMIISPMIVAMMSVLCAMGLLIGTGNTLHIMSSMIPIFLMPIAVVDSIHILSEFFDNYRTIGDRRKTLEHVMGHLFMPMLYTSLTSAAGFASLALTPIPPVQAFGIFVAIGIMLAWLFTIVFVPAY